MHASYAQFGEMITQTVSLCARVTRPLIELLITQEHPLLGVPFFMLHPCHTSRLMSQVRRDLDATKRADYLLTWLSSVGPVTGIALDAHYASTLVSDHPKR